MKIFPILAIALAAFPFTAFAEDDEEPVQTQAEMNAEAAAEFKEADAAMNVAYKKVREAQDEEGAEKLKAAQKAWLAFRDAQAAFEAAPNEGGSIYPLELANAKTRLTETRTEELEAILDDHSDPDEASDGEDEDESSDEAAEVPRDANGNAYGHGYNADGADDPNM